MTLLVAIRLNVGTDKRTAQFWENNMYTGIDFATKYYTRMNESLR